MSKPYTVAGIEPLMTLDDAAASIGVTAQKLRTEIKKGRLTPTVVAGTRYVTQSALREMLSLCRVQKAPASISSDTSPANGIGSSETERRNSAQVAAKANLERLKGDLLPTSRKNTSRRPAPALSGKSL